MSDETVYVVTNWVWGGGGDDITEIWGVYRSKENAEKAAKALEDGDVVERTLEP